MQALNITLCFIYCPLPKIMKLMLFSRKTESTCTYESTNNHKYIAIYNESTIAHSCVHGKDIDVDIMVLFAPCVDDNTLAIIHVNLVPYFTCTCTQECVIVNFHNAHHEYA